MGTPTNLFDPFLLGPLTLPNRVVMAPLTRNRAVPPGMVASELAVRGQARTQDTSSSEGDPCDAGLLIARDGGLGLDLPAGLDIVRTLAKIEGSIGWSS
jgi:hypothetical protein